MWLVQDHRTNNMKVFKMIPYVSKDNMDSVTQVDVATLSLHLQSAALNDFWSSLLKWYHRF